MDAYVLGQHDGDLPTHLLQTGEAGNRVRAMATLDGPDHNVFYAVEGADKAAVDAHVQSIAAAGTTVGHTVAAGDGSADDPEWRMIGISHPSHMPPWLYYIFWHILHPGDPVEAGAKIGEVRDLLGTDNVAAAKTAEGHLLVEVGGNDQSHLDQAKALLEAHFGNNLSGGHAVSGSGIVKA